MFVLFYERNGTKCKKVIKKGIITNSLTPRGFAYWIMSDGSLQNDGKTLIMHTQSFSFQENTVLSNELNRKFGLSSRVILHKKKYYVIKIPKNNYSLLCNLVSEYIIPSMRYKIIRD